jgi:hypothetical protein
MRKQVAVVLVCLLALPGIARAQTTASSAVIAELTKMLDAPPPGYKSNYESMQQYCLMSPTVEVPKRKVCLALASELQRHWTELRAMFENARVAAQTGDTAKANSIFKASVAPLQRFRIATQQWINAFINAGAAKQQSFSAPRQRIKT